MHLLVPGIVGGILLLLLWPKESEAEPEASIDIGMGDPNLNTIDGATLGERNNNPGNIKWSAANQWQGQTGENGGYATFDTASNGIRAIAHTLRSYSARGVTSVNDMIRRWSSTNQDAYVNNVAKALQMGISDEPDLDDADTMDIFVTAIIHQENGRVIYPDTLISSAVQS